KFPHIFRPLELPGVTLRNRIAISGHFAGWWVGEKGLPTDAFVAYVEERAKGGVGLFVIGATSPQPGSGWLENTSDEIIPRYAAKRAAAGSVDGVELHSHESFLHAQMLNPIWNTRTDEYGGSLENRMRFLIETLTAMRQAIGDKPLGVRLKLDDMAQRGMTPD